MRYPFAIVDHNMPSDQPSAPVSVHRRRETAIRAAEKLNRAPNKHYRAVHWDAPATAREYPAAPLDAAVILDGE